MGAKQHPFLIPLKHLLLEGQKKEIKLTPKIKFPTMIFFSRMDYLLSINLMAAAKTFSPFINP